MKKIFYIILTIGLFSSTYSQTAKELYKEAFSFYINKEYGKAVEILDRIDKIESSGVKTENLRREIKTKLNENTQIVKKEAQSESLTNIESDQELYKQAVLLYNDGKYIESLQLLKSITNPKINTQPLTAEINKKINTIKPQDIKINTNEISDINKSDIKRPREEKTPEKINLLGNPFDVNRYNYESMATATNVPRNQDNEIEQTAIELASLDMNNKSKKPSSLTKPLINEKLQDRGDESNYTFYRYLLGMILFLSISVIGFVLLKRKILNTNQSNIHLINLSSNMEYLFDKEEIKIGRTQNNDFVINEAEVSKNHAIIKYDKKNNRFLIKDLGSTNGTLINGKRISLSELKNGDIINFNKTNFRVKID
jgi:hypothetical protein